MVTTIITIAIITIGNMTMPIFMFMNATAVSRVGVGAGGSGASRLMQGSLQMRCAVWRGSELPGLLENEGLGCRVCY